MPNSSSLSLQQSNVLIEVLYPWLKQFNESLMLEEHSSEGPSVALYRKPESEKYDLDVIGGYSARFEFSLSYKVAKLDTDTKLEATRVLTDLVAHFNDTPPTLTEKDRVIKIEAVTNPALVEEKEGKDLFRVDCVLIYRHRMF